MSSSNVMLLALAALAAGGVFSRTLAESGISRLKALYLLFCVFTLNELTFSPADEALISPACILLAVFAYSGAVIMENANGALSLPAAGVSAAAAVMLFGADNTAAVCFASAAVAALISPLMSGTLTAAASVTLAPLIAEFAAFVIRFYGCGYTALNISQEALCAQLAGIFAVILLKTVFQSLKRSLRTNDRKLSYDSTTSSFPSDPDQIPDR